MFAWSLGLSLVAAATPLAGDLVDGPAPAPLVTSSLPRELVPGRALLERHGDVSYTALGVKLVRELHHGWALVAFASAVPLDEEQTKVAIAALRRDPRVKDAAPDRWFAPALVPQDPLLEQQWPLVSAGLFAAWDKTTGNESQLIGIIDTGTFVAHPELAGRDVLGYDFISDVALAFDGDGRDDDYTDPGLPTTCGEVALNLTTHGTHIAGIIAANADGAGMVGLNFAAGLVTARAMNACGGAESDLLDALAWLGGARVDGTPLLGRAVDVINLSLGAQGSCGGALQAYVTQLYEDSGVIVVAAAGNDGNEAAVRVPASCEHVIAVGAHGRGPGLPLSPYSNTAGVVDVIAPGGDRATDPQDAILSLCGASADCYQFAQGTSMATAFVSGAVSLVLAAYPGIDRTRVLEVLQQSGQPCTGCGEVPALRVDEALLLAATIPSGVPVSSPCDEGLCGPGGLCDDDQRCLTLGGTSCCYSRCEEPIIGSCGEGRRCALVENGNVCVEAGDLHEGSPCDPAASACRDGHICGTSNGVSQCIRLCGPSGGVCRSTSQSCREAGDFSVCAPVLLPSFSDTEERCDPARGHFDCDEQWGCVVPDDGTPPVCVYGAAGDLLTGERCTDAAACASGLCSEGLCTEPCNLEGACYLGATCAPEGVPGGLCVPDVCESDQSCPAGRSCEDVDGAPRCVRVGCACGQSAGPVPMVGPLGLVLAAALLARRRRSSLAGRRG